MKNGKKLLSFTLTLFALLANMSATSGKDIQLTDNDKAQIIKSILIEENLLGRGLRIGEVRGVIYLSTVNIAHNLVPMIRDVRIILLNPDEEANWPKTGISLFEFSKFEIKGSKVIVSLTDTWFVRSKRFSYRRSVYEFRKVSGKWIGTETERSMAMP